MFHVEVDPNKRQSHGDSIISMLDRSSIMDIEKKKNYQNTYKLEPDEKTPMNEAKQIITDVVKGNVIFGDYITYKFRNLWGNGLRHCESKFGDGYVAYNRNSETIKISMPEEISCYCASILYWE